MIDNNDNPANKNISKSISNLNKKLREMNIKFDTDDILKSFNEKNEIKAQEETKPVDEVTKKWNMNDKIIELFANNIKKDQELKEKYAIILIVILSIQLIALLTIFILKGCGVLNYSDSSFNLFITGGIAEVFVLVRVIVKYLFKDNLKDSLNIILESNNKFKRYKNNKDKSDKK